MDWLQVGVQRNFGSGFQGNGRRAAAIADRHRARATSVRLDSRARQLPIFPRYVHFVAAACAQTFHRARRPGGGQRGKQNDFARVTLQEHFRDAGDRAEIAVDLERRMRVEQIRVSPAAGVEGTAVAAGHGKQMRQDEIRVVTVEQPRPEIDFPRETPARAGIAARLERDLGGIK